MKSFKQFMAEAPKFKKGDMVHFHDDLKRMQQGTVKSIQNIKGTTVYKLDRHGVKFSRTEKELHESEEKADKFRRKPNVISAFQWKGVVDDIPDEIKNHKMFTMKGNTVSIKTLEGTMVASLNDWIVIGVAKELFPVKPDVFKKNYAKE